MEIVRTKFYPIKKPSNIGDKIQVSSHKEYQALIGTGYWLNKSVSFDSNLVLNENHKILSNQLFYSLQLKIGYKHEQKLNDFETLLANLFYYPKQPIKISLVQSEYVRTQYNKNSYFIIELIEILEKEKYIIMKKGYNIEKDSRITRIWATEKLLQYCPEYPSAVLYKPFQLVILRDDKGALKQYKDTAETWRIRTILKRANEVNNNAFIRYKDCKISIFLLAIFKEKFTLYGRLHTRGFRHYQGFEESERAEITINNLQVIERDFRALHPNLLYASEGIQYNEDPYSIVDNNPDARQFLKQVLLCMLNSKDIIQAERVSNYYLFNHPSEKQLLNAIGITSAKPLINKFIEIHKPISKYFFQGKKTGLKIMNKDSKIALDIISHFTKQNIPILSIHDSFIVEKINNDELVKIMKQTYSKHTKGFNIEVK